MKDSSADEQDEFNELVGTDVPPPKPTLAQRIAQAINGMNKVEGNDWIVMTWDENGE